MNSMDWLGNVEIDPVLHQPVRTRIAAYLSARGEASFTELKRALTTTDGNLEAHLKKLIAVRYIKVKRQSAEPRPQTTYRLTSSGAEALQRYVEALQHLLKFSD